MGVWEHLVVSVPLGAIVFGIGIASGAALSLFVGVRLMQRHRRIKASSQGRPTRSDASTTLSATRPPLENKDLAFIMVDGDGFVRRVGRTFRNSTRTEADLEGLHIGELQHHPPETMLSMMETVKATGEGRSAVITILNPDGQDFKARIDVDPPGPDGLFPFWGKEL